MCILDVLSQLKHILKIIMELFTFGLKDFLCDGFLSSGFILETAVQRNLTHFQSLNGISFTSNIHPVTEIFMAKI